jgi:hypothetical protein
LVALIAGADHRARNAFLATLKEYPSTTALLPVLVNEQTDVLEVRDLPKAIRRAEEVIRERKSRPGSAPEDIFDSLVANKKTDDTSGPHEYRRNTPTPVPPPPQTYRLIQATNGTLPLNTLSAQAAANLHIPPAVRTAPILILDEDAFYHPAGRIRGFADVTLDPDRSYVPESTLLMRIRQRRNLLAWVVAAVLAPLTLLALFGVAVNIGRARAARESAAHSAMTTKPIQTTQTKPIAAPPPPAPTPIAAAAPQNHSQSVPVANVKSLKSAPSSKRR